MKNEGKTRNHYIFLAAFCLLFFLIGSIILIYHHYTDYDIASSLLFKTPLPNAGQTQKITALSQIHHIFVIVEENHNWQGIYNNAGAPFINKTLLPVSAFAQQYYNVPKDLNALHPSEPNYILLESGRIAFPDHTFATDNPPSLTNSTNSHSHLAYLLEQKKLTWKSYQEDIPVKDCPISAVNNYAPKHNPFIYFQDISGKPPSHSTFYCQQHIRPLSELQRDLANGTIANYTFITPNLQHDMHDGTVTQADTWLAIVVPMITHSSTFQQDGALFITWDEGNEGEDENRPIGMIITSPFIKQGYTNTVEYSHPSFLKTVEEIFSLSPLLGMAADTKTHDLSDFFQVKN